MQVEESSEQLHLEQLADDAQDISCSDLDISDDRTHHAVGSKEDRRKLVGQDEEMSATKLNNLPDQTKVGVMINLINCIYVVLFSVIEVATAILARNTIGINLMNGQLMNSKICIILINPVNIFSVVYTGCN